MKGLTDRQETVLKFIVTFLEKNGFPPTYQEIADKFGIASKHGVVRHLQALEKKGYISRGETTARSIRIIHEDYKSSSEDMMSIPLIGRVAAGMPILAEEHIEDNVAVPRRLIRSAEKHFALRVKGESMINAGIMDGDLVIVQPRDTANPNQIVVALIEDDNEATVKRLIRKDNSYYLKAENPDFEDIFPEGSWRIQGRVVGLIRESFN